ncbi:MAG: hypothetical protein E7174_03920 [Firmicutes bacterium]|nr:hypothetical protein [Bacillota bacterium]
MFNEKEYDKVINNHFKEIENYIEKISIPDLVAFYVYSGFNNSTLWEKSLNKIINTCLEYINVNINISNELVDNIKKNLKNKYNIEIINLDPLELRTK